MIFDRLDYVSSYHAIHPRLEAALRYISELDRSITDGVHPIDGDDLVARVQSYATRDESEQGWESHRQYVDVQVLLSGEEKILYAPIDALVASTSYDSGADLLRYERGVSEPQSLRLTPDSFAIFFPHDGHKPGVMISSPLQVRKLVVKVRVW